MCRRSRATRGSSWRRRRAGRATARRRPSPTGASCSTRCEDLDAVAITTPPTVRYEIARECLERGLHVLLEKPPSATLSDIEDLACIAETEQRTPVHHLARAAQCGGRSGGAGARRQAHRRDADRLARGRAQMAPGPAVDLGAGRVRRVRPRHQRLLDRDQDLPRAVVREAGAAELSRRCANADRRGDRLRQPGRRRAAALQPRLAAKRGRGVDDHRPHRRRRDRPAGGRRRQIADRRRPAGDERDRRISRHLPRVRAS